MTIKVTAITPLAGDAVHRTLDVEPDGIPQFQTKSLFINLNETFVNLIADLKLDVPLDAIPDSAKVEVSIAGIICQTFVLIF